MRAEKVLKFLLQMEAAVLFLAIPAILMPTEWMGWAHEKLGLGTFPQGVIVEYLTRSLSLLYAGWAPLLLYVSLDIRRYASLIAFLAIVRIVMGLVLLGLDLTLDMPWFWTVAEGPSIIGVSAIQYWLARKMND